MNIIQEYINNLNNYLASARKKSNDKFHDAELTQKKIKVVEEFLKDFEDNSFIANFLSSDAIDPLALESIRKTIARLQGFNIVLEMKHLKEHRSTLQNMLNGDNPVLAWLNSSDTQSSLHKITERTLNKIDEYLLAHSPEYSARLEYSAIMSLIQYCEQKLVIYLIRDLDDFRRTKPGYTEYDKYELGTAMIKKLKALAIAFLDKRVPLSEEETLNQLGLLLDKLRDDNNEVEENHGLRHASFRENAGHGFFRALARRTLFQSRLNTLIEDVEDRIQFMRATYGWAPQPGVLIPLDYNDAPSPAPTPTRR